MKKSDSQIQQEVLQELQWDTRVDETEVGVQVAGGVVTLTGNVSSWAKRSAAKEAAHRVAGVLDVANDLKVVIPGHKGRTDTEVAQAVRHALAWDVFVPEGRIQSTVSEGVVTLEGEVDNGNERRDAERAVRNLAGVRWVTNRLTIRPHQATPREVRQAIERALDRQAEEEARNIKIDVEDGRVALHGTVHSWMEKAAAVEAAEATPGVRSVDDQLHLDTLLG